MALVLPLVGKGDAGIVDTWWQTENGGFLGSTLPGLQPMKPGSCGPGVLGVFPVVYDENGDEVPTGSGKAGNICIRNPWQGSSRRSGVSRSVLGTKELESAAV